MLSVCCKTLFTYRIGSCLGIFCVSLLHLLSLGKIEWCIKQKGFLQPLLIIRLCVVLRLFKVPISIITNRDNYTTNGCTHGECYIYAGDQCVLQAMRTYTKGCEGMYTTSNTLIIAYIYVFCLTISLKIPCFLASTLNKIYKG